MNDINYIKIDIQNFIKTLITEKGGWDDFIKTSPSGAVALSKEISEMHLVWSRFLYLINDEILGELVPSMLFKSNEEKQTKHHILLLEISFRALCAYKLIKTALGLIATSKNIDEVFNIFIDRVLKKVMSAKGVSDADVIEYYAVNHKEMLVQEIEYLKNIAKNGVYKSDTALKALKEISF